MSQKILLVDDESHVLEGYHRNLRRQFHLEVALGGVQAIQAMEEHGPFGVLVSDMRMPGMSGMELLEEVRTRFPDTIRIMLTGNADQQTAVDAVNRGAVFRFLNKPCSATDLALAIEAGLRQHQLIRAERDLLEQTLTGAIQVLTEVVSLRAPMHFELASTTRDLVRHMGGALGLEATWPLEAAAMLAPLGSLCPKPIFESTLKRDPFHPYSEEELQLSARMIEAIPRMEEVARILRYSARHLDGSSPVADGICGEALPVESRILFVATAFNAIVRTRHHRVVALEELRRHMPWLDPRVFLSLEQEVVSRYRDEGNQVLPVGALREGHVLAKDITLSGGFVVFPAGTRLGRAHLLMLSDLAQLLNLPEAIEVRSAP